MKILSRVLILAMLVATVGLFGCADDGSNGADGVSSYQAAVDAGLIDPAVISEADFYAGLTDAVNNANAPLAHPEESCNVCHGVGKALGIDTLHPLVDPKLVIADIVVTSGAGATDTVDFMVYEEDGVTPVPGLTLDGFRFYIADIVPAGTTTATTFVDTVNPVTTWDTQELERWLYERSSTAGAVLDDNGGGSYTYHFVADIALGGADAPDFNIAHTQRLMIRAGDIEDVVGTPDLSREAAIVEFTIPADGVSTAVLSQDETSFSRAIVLQEACSNCHGDPLQSAAHGSSYQTPQGCVICHTPIGDAYGDEMQADGAWLATLIHKIHSAIAIPAFANRGYDEVTYPQDIKDCSVCHFDDGQAQADSWKTNPTAEACGTCHDVTFGAAATHTGGTQVNSACVTCHPADGNGFGQSVSGAHAVVYDRDNLDYNVTISLSPDANADNVYEVGETILVTATVDAPGFDYTNADSSFLRSANLYVYGPRALAKPVLTPGSTTDPGFVLEFADDPTMVPDQGVSMLAGADAQVQTDATGFKYQLLEVTADMAAGTYMIQTNIDYSSIGDRTTDGRHIGPRFYPLDGWELVTFQVKTATDEPKVAGECTSCHQQKNFSTFAHRSYFGTDGCLACHDQSGNHADPLTNRTHAVHGATEFGDLADRDWTEITFPRSLNASCAACHNSGNNSHRENPNGSFGFACIGCHGDTEGARQHMEQNGAPFPTH